MCQELEKTKKEARSKGTLGKVWRAGRDWVANERELEGEVLKMLELDKTFSRNHDFGNDNLIKTRF